MANHQTIEDVRQEKSNGLMNISTSEASCQKFKTIKNY